jgi:phosphoesterase family protein
VARRLVYHGAGRRLNPARALLVGLALGILLLPAQPYIGPSPIARPPAFDHIFVILEENEDFAQIVGNPDAPFINHELIAHNFLERHYFALDHGSLPDYLGLVSGSEQLQAIGDPPSDCQPNWAATPPTCAISAPPPSNIADTIEGAGKTWRAYFQSMEWPCRWQSQSHLYDVIHNPFVYFASIEGGTRTSSPRCVTHDVDMFQDAGHSLSSDLQNAPATPNFLFLVPNNVSSMHDGSIRAGDQFLQDIFTGTNRSGQNGTNPVDIFASEAWTTGRSIAYVVWDENSGTPGNQVPVIEVGRWVNGPGGWSERFSTHYAMLRSWEAAWGLPPIQSGSGDAVATPMLDAFTLVNDSASARGSAFISGTLRMPHPEIFAQARVRIPPGSSSRRVLSLFDSQRRETLRLSIDGDAHLGMGNGVTGISLTGAEAVSAGWHTVAVHLWTRASQGTCEVFWDGSRVQSLTDVGACAAGSAPTLGYALGDRTGGGSGVVEVDRLVLATSEPSA